MKQIMILIDFSQIKINNMRIPLLRLLCIGLHIECCLPKKLESFGFLNIDSAKQPILPVEAKWLEYEYALATASVSQLLHVQRN